MERAPSLWLRDGNRVRVGFGNGTEAFTAESNASLVPYQWNHVVVTFDGSAATFIVNGVLDTTTQLSATPVYPSGSGVVTLGTVDVDFVGELSDVRIYRGVLTLQQARDVRDRSPSAP